MTLIPPELVDRILSLLNGKGRQAALLSCALVSSEFYATAKPAIYSDIKIGYIPYPETLEDAPMCSPPLWRLMKLASHLEHDPTPGSLVKTLHLRLEPAVFRASSDSSGLPEDRALRPLVTLLRSLTRLEAFRIDNCGLSQWFSTADPVTAEVVRICNLPTLRTLALNSCGIPSRVWFQNTSLSSIILKPYSPVAPELADTWKRLVPVSNPDPTTRSTGNITRLAYQQESITDLVDLVKEAPWAFEGLRTVKLHISSFRFRSEMAEPWEIGPFLRRTAATLEVLDWRLDLIDPRDHTIPFFPIQDPFAGFPRLRRVSLLVKTRDKLEAGSPLDEIRDLFTYFQRNSETIEELDLTLCYLGRAMSCTGVWEMAGRCLHDLDTSFSSPRMRKLDLRVIHVREGSRYQASCIDSSIDGSPILDRLKSIPDISFTLARDCERG